MERRPLRVDELGSYFECNQQSLYKLLHRCEIRATKVMPEELITSMFREAHFKGWKRNTMWRAIRPKMEDFINAVVTESWITPEQAVLIKSGKATAAIKHKVSKQEEAPKKRGRPSKKKPAAEPSGEAGIEAAIGRLRNAERKLHDMWEKALDEEEPNLAEADRMFKQWQNAIECLRKGEDTLQTLLVKRGTLLEADVVRKFYAARVLPVKKRLQRMPNSLCNVLCNEEPTVIRDELDRYVRRCLDDFASDLYEEDDSDE